MADEAARSRLGRGLASLMGDVGDERRRSSVRAASADCRSNSCGRIRATRGAFFPMPILTSLRHRSASAASSSRSSCAPCAARRTPTRSSPANGAGARRSAPACMRFPSSSSRRPTRKRSNSPSSRTCSAPISIRSKRRKAIAALSEEFNRSQDDIAQDRRQEPQPRRQHDAAVEAHRHREGLHSFRQAHRRTRAHAGRPAQRRRAGRRDRHRGLNVRQVEALARDSGKEQAKELKPKRRERQGCRYAGAGETAVGCARPAGQQSTIAATGACCISTTAISNSSTRCCGSWRSAEKM